MGIVLKFGFRQGHYTWDFFIKNLIKKHTHNLKKLLKKPSIATNGHKLGPTDGVSCRPTVTEPGFFPGKERG